MFKGLLNLIAPLSSVPKNERREKIRARCGIRVTLRTRKDSYEATVVNVSAVGLCVELDATIKAREPVSLHRREFGAALQGTVGWSRTRPCGKRQMGVIFAKNEQMLEDSWLLPALEKLGYSRHNDDERRRYPRIPGRVPCTIHSFDSDVHYKGYLLDLSPEGALVEGIWPLPLKSEARFRFESIAGLPVLTGIAMVMSNQCVQKSPPKYRTGLKFLERHERLTRQYMKVMMSAR